MNEEHRNALEQSLDDICRDLDAEDVLAYLRAKNIVNPTQYQELRAISRQDRCNIQLIDIIKASGPLAFREFITSLESINKGFLAKKILARLQPPPAQECNQPECTYKSLEEMYLSRFRNVYPFSLPFTFDIENTWISLAIREYDNKNSQPIEDHAKLLERVFEKDVETVIEKDDKVKMLIIEGNPATGKTSLMRRLAYEWAKGKQELSHYNLVIYAEFREVREQSFEKIVDLVLCYSKKYLKNGEYQNLKRQIQNEEHCKTHTILILLDGYDESSLARQCSELSKFLSDKTICQPLLFNVVVTARKGYLSHLREHRGRFMFAEVIGFTTNEQKLAYINRHFSSVDNAGEKIKAVQELLTKNENLNKLAETPLFLTFICLVHQKIVDGTLLELYLHIIWWLIDRHQKDFPDRDVPGLFGFQNNSADKFRTIQDSYLQFPQLHHLGKMALTNLKSDVLEKTDLHQFNIEPVVEQVGLLRKNEYYDNSFKLRTTYAFPHRTVQEFLAAFYYLKSDENRDQILSINSEINTYTMNEYEKFLFRIASSTHISIDETMQSKYFKGIMNLTLDLAFDTFKTTTGFNSELLLWVISQCENIQTLKFNRVKQEEICLPQISVETEILFSNLKYLNSLTFNSCIFEVDSPISFANCPSLESLEFNYCAFKSAQSIDLSELLVMDILRFRYCTIIRGSLVSFANCPPLTQLEFAKCSIKSSASVAFSNLISLHILNFDKCTIESDSLISFANCPSLKYLKFDQCEIESGASIDFAKLPALENLQFKTCTTDLKAWQSITDEIARSPTKELSLSFHKDFDNGWFSHLNNCKNVEKIEIWNCSISKGNLSFHDLINLHTLALWYSTFEADSQITFTSCASLKYITFNNCEISSSVILDFSKFSSALDALELNMCSIDLRIWQSIVDEITKNSVKKLKISFKDFNTEFLNYLKMCNTVEKIEVEINNFDILKHNGLSMNDLIHLDSLKFEHCNFRANSQLSLTNCPSLKSVKFNDCVIKKSFVTGISKLPALDHLEFNNCTISLKSWRSIAEKVTSTSIKQLKVSFGEEFDNAVFSYLRKCNRVGKIELCIAHYNMSEGNNILSVKDLNNLHSFTFKQSTFDASSNSQISFINCPSLKCLKFDGCEIKNSFHFRLAELPALGILQFNQCTIDSKAWQMITDEINRSFVKKLKLSDDLLKKQEQLDFINHLKKCTFIEVIEINGSHTTSSKRQVATSYCNLAEVMKGLKSLTINDCNGKMKDVDIAMIERAAQGRYPDFKVELNKEMEKDYKLSKSDLDISHQLSGMKEIDVEESFSLCPVKCNCL